MKKRWDSRFGCEGTLRTARPRLPHPGNEGSAACGFGGALLAQRPAASFDALKIRYGGEKEMAQL